LSLATLKQLLSQQLRTDQLLGVRSVPLVWPDFSSNKDDCSDARGAGGDSTPTASARAASSQANASGSPQEDQLRLLNDTQVRSCTKCSLCKGRTQTVFGQGSASPRLVFVGEAPGYEEDKQGLAFVGRAGQLLTRMIIAMGLTREEVYICNVLKCRPPNNRDPSAEEILACSPYLRAQLEILRPEVLVTLGSPASKTLLSTVDGIGKLRGRFHDFYPSGHPSEGPSVPLMPTYHPAYLLRSPSEKGKTWGDLQMVMSLLGLPAPSGS